MVTIFCLLSAVFYWVVAQKSTQCRYLLYLGERSLCQILYLRHPSAYSLTATALFWLFAILGYISPMRWWVLVVAPAIWFFAYRHGRYDAFKSFRKQAAWDFKYFSAPDRANEPKGQARIAYAKSRMNMSDAELGDIAGRAVLMKRRQRPNR